MKKIRHHNGMCVQLDDDGLPHGEDAPAITNDRHTTWQVWMNHGTLHNNNGPAVAATVSSDCSIQIPATPEFASVTIAHHHSKYGVRGWYFNGRRVSPKVVSAHCEDIFSPTESEIITLKLVVSSLPDDEAYNGIMP